MNVSRLNVWCNAHFPDPAMGELRDALQGHELILSPSLQKSNLVSAGPDPLLNDADVAFGQPDPVQIITLPKLKWVQLTSAGYGRYDRPDLRAALKHRGAVITNSSGVYAEPCAQHLLAMMLSLARRLPQAWDDQRGPHAWPAAEVRIHSHLLTGQTALLLGFGAIGLRLAELLAPFNMNLIAIRRSVKGDEPIRTVPTEQVDRFLPHADHVINILPAGPQTDGFITRARIAAMKPTAILYNIGRGATIDQTALREALTTGRLAAAYLDVTDPEPPAPDDPIWSTPNCYLTPHAAGGHATEFHRLVRHFLDNFNRFVRGAALHDRVV